MLPSLLPSGLHYCPAGCDSGLAPAQAHPCPASPHLCQLEAEAGVAQLLAFVASGQWGSDEGRALSYKGVLLAQARTPREGHSGPTPPQGHSDFFFCLSCSAGKACGSGCGSRGDPKGLTGRGWHCHVSRIITLITKPSIPVKSSCARFYAGNSIRTNLFLSGLTALGGREALLQTHIQTKEMKLREVE